MTIKIIASTVTNMNFSYQILNIFLLCPFTNLFHARMSLRSKQEGIMIKFLELLFGTTVATSVATHLIQKKKQPLKKFQSIYNGKFEITHPLTHKTNLIHITQNLDFVINHKHVDGEIIEINERHLLFRDALGFQIEIVTKNNRPDLFIDEIDQVQMPMLEI